MQSRFIGGRQGATARFQGGLEDAVRLPARRGQYLGIDTVKRQRIGILLHDFSFGGTERIALRLAGEWAARGREVSIICGDRTGAIRTNLADGITVISPHKPIARTWGSRQRLAAWAAKACRAQAIQGLFVPGNFHFAALPALRGPAASDIAVVCKISNPVHRSDRRPWAQQYSQRRMAARLARADAVVAMSAALAQEAREALGSLPFSVIEEPILDDRLRPDKDLEGERRGIVAAGRFVPQKNFALAVQTLAHLGDKTTELTIIGDGAELNQVGELARRLGLARRVYFPGRVGDVRPWLSTSRVLLLSSRYEGFPAIAVEALASGVRVVATDCSPAIREIISSAELGEIVPSADPREMAAAIGRQLAATPVTQAAIRRLHRQFGLGRSAGRYLELFDSL